MDEELLDSILADMQGDTDKHMADGLKPVEAPAEGHSVTITITAPGAAKPEEEHEEEPVDGIKSDDGGYSKLMEGLV